MFPLRFVPLLLSLLLAVDVSPLKTSEAADYSHNCKRSLDCGKMHMDSSKPFRVQGDTENCGSDELQLTCEHNMVVLYLGSSSNKYYIVPDSINYQFKTIRVIDPGLQKGNCSTLPLYSSLSGLLRYDIGVSEDQIYVIFASCRNPVASRFYVNTAPCLSTKDFINTSFDQSESPSYSYVIVGKNLVASDIEENCTIYRIIYSAAQSLNVSGERNMSFQDIHDAISSGFDLQWGYVSWYGSYIRAAGSIFGITIGARAGLGYILLLVFFIYKWQRRHLSVYDNIEEFLRGGNNLMPIRYSYRQIKKMTNNFKEKLGEGGYGSVFKGKLRSGQIVAIKMLTKSKANGQEFINEVAALGRIHHVNVVRLVGFCATASKHALVYDYMPNGSLDKFIFGVQANGIQLSWEKAFQIAKGVARGLEYLHQGCNMQILHFDIKPHNILLDENFVAKVSDFGLAKLRPIQESVLSLTAVRGTLGYMAPELFYKRVGKVSNKADVYSYGMLLMEMAGKRRNLNASVEHSSQIYFPSWIYDKFDQGENIVIEDATEDENKIARKLILIALWCIQMTPTDRPSMRDVVEMLEGELESLKLPPKPIFYPPDSPILESRSSHSSSEESTEPLCRSISLEIKEVD